jgi:hypothetical protein
LSRLSRAQARAAARTRSPGPQRTVTNRDRLSPGLRRSAAAELEPEVAAARAAGAAVRVLCSARGPGTQVLPVASSSEPAAIMRHHGMIRVTGPSRTEHAGRRSGAHSESAAAAGPPESRGGGRRGRRGPARRRTARSESRLTVALALTPGVLHRDYSCSEAALRLRVRVTDSDSPAPPAARAPGA